MAVFPRIVNVCAALVENWYSKYAVLDVNREPLMHLCLQQLVFWIQEVHGKLARKRLLHFDLQDMFMSLFELYEIVLIDKANYPVAELFASQIRRMSVSISRL